MGDFDTKEHEYLYNIIYPVSIISPKATKPINALQRNDITSRALLLYVCPVVVAVEFFQFLQMHSGISSTPQSRKDCPLA